MRGFAIAWVLVSLALASGCADKPSIHLREGGSSTVFPLVDAWSDALASSGFAVAAASEGTGRGFERFCNGELDLAGASRPIRADETERCGARGIRPQGFHVATDGIVLVVAAGNEFLHSLSFEEIAWIWSDANASRTWRDLRADWPDEELRLAGPGLASGTRDFFIEAVLASRNLTMREDYLHSEDDDVIAQYVRASPYALGFFGRAYLEQSQPHIRAIALRVEGQPIDPTLDNIESGTYPLARPLFLYAVAPLSGGVAQFVRYAIDEGQGVVADVGYLPLSDSQRMRETAKLSSP